LDRDLIPEINPQKCKVVVMALFCVEFLSSKFNRSCY